MLIAQRYMLETISEVTTVCPQNYSRFTQFWNEEFQQQLKWGGGLTPRSVCCAPKKKI